MPGPQNQNNPQGGDNGGQNNGGGTPPANGGDNNNGGGTPPANGGDNNAQVDLKTLPADQLAAVLENPALWDTPRMKELLAGNKELKDLKTKMQQDEEKRLEDEKKFEDLANSRKTDLEKALEQNNQMRIDQALTGKLVPEGIIDLEGALKLVDRSKLSIDDNGVVSGLDEALASLKTDKAYLFKTGEDGKPVVMGSPSNNNGGGDGGNGAPAKFKRSQLSDPAFYKEHRDEILKAAAAGLIEDDLT